MDKVILGGFISIKSVLESKSRPIYKIFIERTRFDNVMRSDLRVSEQRQYSALINAGVEYSLISQEEFNEIMPNANAGGVAAEVGEFFQGAAANGGKLRYDDCIIAHFSHFQRISADRTKLRKFRFTDVVKVNAAKEQGFAKVFELLFHLLADCGGLVGRSPVEPVAFNGVYNCDTDFCFTAGESGVQTGEVIFYHGKLVPPRRLIVDCSRIIPFCFTFHGHPREMRNTHCYTKAGLPVALQLIAAEIVIPAGNAI